MRGKLMGWAAALVCLLAAAEVTARIEDWIRYRTPLTFGGSMEILQFRDSLTVRGRPLARFKHFRLDSLGFRGADVPRTPRAGCTRVLALGASETFGFTEPAGKEFPAQLADSLAVRGCFEVLNGGLMGITGPNVIRYWTEWARQFRPAMVLYYPTPRFYLANEPPRPLSPISPERQLRRHPWKLRMVSRIYDAIQFPDAVQAWRARRALTKLAKTVPPSWFYASVPQDRLRQFRHDLDSLITSVRAERAEPILLTHATRFGESLTPSDLPILTSWRASTPRATERTIFEFERSAARVLLEVARERGVRIIDLASRLGGRHEFFVDAAHFTSSGASQVAAILRDSLVVWSRPPSPAP